MLKISNAKMLLWACNYKRYAILLMSITLIFLSKCAAHNNRPHPAGRGISIHQSEDNEHTNEHDTSEHLSQRRSQMQGRAALNILDKETGASHDTVLEEHDEYLFLLTDNETFCMKIENETDIPTAEQSNRAHFGEQCDPVADNCLRYTVKETKSGGSCFTPTHLLCDAATKHCVCGVENMVVSPVHFQFGNEHGMNVTHGRCLIRPTFDVIKGFECSPGTEKAKIVIDDEIDAVEVCSCTNDDELDKFNSANPDWWMCRGSMVVSLPIGILIGIVIGIFSGQNLLF